VQAPTVDDQHALMTRGSGAGDEVFEFARCVVAAQAVEVGRGLGANVPRAQRRELLATDPVRASLDVLAPALDRERTGRSGRFGLARLRLRGPRTVAVGEGFRTFHGG
jgi:hypothetical protein